MTYKREEVDSAIGRAEADAERSYNAERDIRGVFLDAVILATEVKKLRKLIDGPYTERPEETIGTVVARLKQSDPRAVDMLMHYFHRAVAAEQRAERLEGMLSNLIEAVKKVTTP